MLGTSPVCNCLHIHSGISACLLGCAGRRVIGPCTCGCPAAYLSTHGWLPAPQYVLWVGALWLVCKEGASVTVQSNPAPCSCSGSRLQPAWPSGARLAPAIHPTWTFSLARPFLRALLGCLATLGGVWRRWVRKAVAAPQPVPQRPGLGAATFVGSAQQEAPCHGGRIRRGLRAG